MTMHLHLEDEPCWEPRCEPPTHYLHPDADVRALIAREVAAALAEPRLPDHYVALDGYGTPTIWHPGSGAYDVPVAVLRRNQVADRGFWDAVVGMCGGRPA